MVGSRCFDWPENSSASFRQCTAARPNSHTQAEKLERIWFYSLTPETSQFQAAGLRDGEASTRHRPRKRSAFPGFSDFPEAVFNTRPAAKQQAQLLAPPSLASCSGLGAPPSFPFSLCSRVAVPRETILPTHERRLPPEHVTHSMASE